MKKNNNHFGEVSSASAAQFSAICWQWDNLVPYASLIVVEQAPYQIFGLVYNQITASDDPVRQVYPYQMTRPELEQAHPEIFAFLQTRINCLTIGYQNDQIFHLLAPTPPQPHAFVAHATDEQWQAFFKNNDFLQILFSQSSLLPNLDELLICLIQRLAQKGLAQGMIDDFLEQFSLLSGNDYRRLKLLLKRLESIL